MVCKLFVECPKNMGRDEMWKKCLEDNEIAMYEQLCCQHFMSKTGRK